MVKIAVVEWLVVVGCAVEAEVGVMVVVRSSVEDCVFKAVIKSVLVVGIALVAVVPVIVVIVVVETTVVDVVVNMAVVVWVVIVVCFVEAKAFKYIVLSLSIR